VKAAHEPTYVMR